MGIGRFSIAAAGMRATDTPGGTIEARIAQLATPTTNGLLFVAFDLGGRAHITAVLQLLAGQVCSSGSVGGGGGSAHDDDEDLFSIED